MAPTLIQERGPCARPIEDKRAELAAVRAELALDEEEVRAIHAIGENAGCMALKGASTEHEGPAQADRWDIDPALAATAARWSIDPGRDLARQELSRAS